MESTCSGNCAEAHGPHGEPICVAGLAEPVEARPHDAYDVTTSISFA